MKLCVVLADVSWRGLSVVCAMALAGLPAKAASPSRPAADVETTPPRARSRAGTRYRSPHPRGGRPSRQSGADPPSTGIVRLRMRRRRRWCEGARSAGRMRMRLPDNRLSYVERLGLRSRAAHTLNGAEGAQRAALADTRHHGQYGAREHEPVQRNWYGRMPHQAHARGSAARVPRALVRRGGHAAHHAGRSRARGGRKHAPGQAPSRASRASKVSGASESTSPGAAILRERARKSLHTHARSSLWISRI